MHVVIIFIPALPVKTRSANGRSFSDTGYAIVASVPADGFFHCSDSSKAQRSRFGTSAAGVTGFAGSGAAGAEAAGSGCDSGTGSGTAPGADAIGAAAASAVAGPVGSVRHETVSNNRAIAQFVRISHLLPS